MRAAPLSERFAVISDIHGNLEALKAVLAQIRARNVKLIYALGDHVWGGGYGHASDPYNCWRLLDEEKVTCLRGMSEIALGTWRKSSVPSAPENATADSAAFIQMIESLGDVICKNSHRCRRICACR